MTFDSTVAVAAQRRALATKRVFLTTTSAAAMVLASALAGIDPAQAQTAQAQTAQTPPAPGQTAQAPNVEEIVVTGSLIIRNGYEAPTPLTVLNAEDIYRDAPINIADFIDKVPVLANSYNSHVGGESTSDGNAGTNAADLRGLGPNRTLVLFDGVRVTANNATGFYSTGGSVDINDLPDALISRVDVVTGGATATYGAGALAGVVNLILDKTFTGLKGTVEGGVTTYGDDQQYAISLTGGTGFANDRGHFLISASDSYTAGVPNAGAARPWIAQNWYTVDNPAYTPTNGQPFYIVGPNVGASIYAPGGVITSGPLKGITFGPGGTPQPYMYGSINDGLEMEGGSWQGDVGSLNGQWGPDASLDVHLVRQNLFSRVSYDLGDDVNVYFQYDYSGVDSAANARAGTTSLTIRSGNPYIPSSIQAQMTADGLASIPLGVYNTSLGIYGSAAERHFNMYLAGADGKFDAFGTNWTWDVFATRSISRTSDTATNVYNKADFLLATNAVRSPTTGAIVCADTLVNPNDGCVPYNPFGTGNASQAVINYLESTRDFIDERIGLDEISATVKGEPLSTWAGPVSFALGFQWSRNDSAGIADPTAIATGYVSGNFNPTDGRYDTTEGFGELVIPLAKDAAWAKSLDLNAGVRLSDFSTSGEVTTWKVGATYSPIDDIRFRVTQSRDTRAPNLGELFAGGLYTASTTLNPWLGNKSVPIFTLTVGNPLVAPEQANTTGLGVVVQPSWFKGFSFSFDYYRIRIMDSLSTLGTTLTVSDCYNYGTYCQNIVQDSSHNITSIYLVPENTTGSSQQGLDIESSYTTPLADIVSSWDGNMSVRVLATHVLASSSTAIDGTMTHSFGNPFRYSVSVNYDNDAMSVGWTGRGETSHPLSSNYIACTSGCPNVASPYFTITDNTIPAQFYMDLSLTYHLKVEDSVKTDLFLTVQDITNGHPPGIVMLSGFADIGNPLGRVFRAGVRFKM